MARTHKKKKQPTKKLFSHHRHTGKVLPHAHTSYPLIALLLLMVGVVLAHLTFRVNAADVIVNATANGPLPPSPAVILSPQNGDRFTAIPIPVSGTCPYPYFVKLYRNNTFSGSTPCNPDGTWLLYSDLFAGENQLQARIVNAADQEGPQSAIVTVYYDVPAPPPGGPSSPGQPAPSADGGTATPAEEQAKPFLISSDIFFKAVYVGDEITWEFEVVGGDPPFRITVAWGDGGTSTVTSLKERTFTVTHVYKSLPTSREYFPVTITATDNNDRKASLQVFSIINDRIAPRGGGMGEGSGGSGIPPGGSIWRIIWPAYAITLLMVVSFWLGERRALLIPLARGPKTLKALRRKHFYKPPRRHA